MEQFRIQRSAEKEFYKAIIYYEKKKAGLGYEFQAEIDEAIENIRRNPYIGTIYGRRNYRCFATRRFPYVIYYAIRHDTLWIASIAHGRRRPRYWDRRKLQ